MPLVISRYLLVVAFICLGNSLRANQVAELNAITMSSTSSYGRSVSLSGNTAIVGDFATDRAYVYRDNGGGNWQQIATLTDNVAGENQFGISVSLEGNTAVVGSLMGNVVQVFTENSAGAWNRTATLNPTNPSQAQGFGKSVSLSQGRVLVGAQRDDGIGGAGSAYVFDGNQGWSQVARLTGSPITSTARYGSSVALEGDTALVGAPFDGGVSRRGAAYVYREDGLGNWSQAAKLTANDPDDMPTLGYDVAVSGGTAVVSSPFAEAAYIYEETPAGSWLQTAALTHPLGHFASRFGISVDIEGDRLIVGSPSNQPNVFFYERDSSGQWTYSGLLVVGKQGFIGDSVSLEGNLILASDTQSSTNAAYIFEAVPRVPEPTSFALLVMSAASIVIYRERLIFIKKR